MKFKENRWIVAREGHKYECIGYELRGMFWCPVVYFDKVTGEAVEADIYEIIKGFKVVKENEFIGGTRLNKTEIALLESVGCKWTGCWIVKA